MSPEASVQIPAWMIAQAVGEWYIVYRSSYCSDGVFKSTKVSKCHALSERLRLPAYPPTILVGGYFTYFVKLADVVGEEVDDLTRGRLPCGRVAETQGLGGGKNSINTQHTRGVRTVNKLPNHDTDPLCTQVLSRRNMCEKKKSISVSPPTSQWLREVSLKISLSLD